MAADPEEPAWLTEAKSKGPTFGWENFEVEKLQELCKVGVLVPVSKKRNKELLPKGKGYDAVFSFLKHKAAPTEDWLGSRAGVIVKKGTTSKGTESQSGFVLCRPCGKVIPVARNRPTKGYASSTKTSFGSAALTREKCWKKHSENQETGAEKKKDLFRAGQKTKLKSEATAALTRAVVEDLLPFGHSEKRGHFEMAKTWIKLGRKMLRQPTDEELRDFIPKRTALTNRLDRAAEKLEKKMLQYLLEADAKVLSKIHFTTPMAPTRTLWCIGASREATEDT